MPGYLQLVVTLMAMMVPPTEESRLWEKRGQEALNQGTSIVLLVSVLLFLYFIKWQYTVILTIYFLHFSERGGHNLGALRL